MPVKRAFMSPRCRYPGLNPVNVYYIRPKNPRDHNRNSTEKHPRIVCVLSFRFLHSAFCQTDVYQKGHARILSKMSIIKIRELQTIASIRLLTNFSHANITHSTALCARLSRDKLPLSRYNFEHNNMTSF